MSTMPQDPGYPANARHCQSTSEHGPLFLRIDQALLSPVWRPALVAHSGDYVVRMAPAIYSAS